jgi:glycosyltransferase involved in cell wall biosynthesis
LLWFGFFIHTEKAFKVFRFVLSFLKIKNEKIILNAWYELPLYAQRLNLKESHLDCMPLGDWQDNEFNNPDYQPPLEDYYFAGGFTNRDYAGLIEAFKSRKENLIIVGSKLNSDLNVDDLPGNILILKDIDKFTFESLVAQSSACILPMKDPDAGASGHMVLLAYMRHKKLILASNFPAIREYLEDGVSALLYNDPLVDLPKMISDHQPSNDKSKKLGEQAYITYQQNFTRQALTKRLIEIIESNVPQNKWKSQAS